MKASVTEHDPYEPEVRGGLFYWWAKGVHEQVGGHWLDREMFFRLAEGDSLAHVSGFWGRCYPTRDAAMDDLLQAMAKFNATNLEKMGVIPRRKTIALVGYGRCGKDTGCDFLSSATYLSNAGTTSKYLCQYMADLQGLTYDEAYARRHESPEMRQKWKDEGDRVRADYPAKLIRMALEHGDITGGVRDIVEIEAGRREGLLDLIVWVRNDRVPKDDTVTFTEADCDITVLNNGSLESYFRNLERLARFAGLPMVPSISFPRTELGVGLVDEPRLMAKANI